MVAPSATMQAGSSEAGSACARLPPIVPRLRIAGCATCAIASVSSGAWAAISGDFSRSTWRVSAPMVRLPPFDRDPAKLSQFADIDNEFGGDQPQIHRRHQALAARQHLGPVAMRGQQLQRMLRRWSRGHKRKPRPSFRRDLPGRISLFRRIRRRPLSKVKLVYRAIISTLDLSWCHGRSTFAAK